MTPDDATINKLVWKSGDTLAFAGEVVTVALRGIEFNNDDVSESVQPLDKTTVGIVFRLLKNMGIIEPTDRVRASSRPCCNGHRNLLWRLASHGKATALLRANAMQIQAGQIEFQLEAA